jgi:hypothetical protein
MHLLSHTPETSATPAAVEDDEVPQCPTFVDLLAAAHTAFPDLFVTADPAPATALDEHENAELWRGKASAALSTLNPELVDHVEDPVQREQAEQAMAALGIGPDAVARAIAFAIEQPDDVDIGDLTIRPSRQS